MPGRIRSKPQVLLKRKRLGHGQPAELANSKYGWRSEAGAEDTLRQRVTLYRTEEGSKSCMPDGLKTGSGPATLTHLLGRRTSEGCVRPLRDVRDSPILELLLSIRQVQEPGLVQAFVLLKRVHPGFEIQAAIGSWGRAQAVLVDSGPSGSVQAGRRNETHRACPKPYE